MRLRDVKQGEMFIEECFGHSVLLEALESAHEVGNERSMRNGHECKVRVVRGKAGMAGEDGTLTLFEAHDPGCYGLRLYRTDDVRRPSVLQDEESV